MTILDKLKLTTASFTCLTSLWPPKVVKAIKSVKSSKVCIIRQSLKDLTKTEVSKNAHIKVFVHSENASVILWNIHQFQICMILKI